MNSIQHQTSPIEPLLTVKDIAAILGVGKRTLQSWLAGGQLPQADVRVGKTRRWRRETIMQWIDRQPQTA